MAPRGDSFFPNYKRISFRCFYAAVCSMAFLLGRLSSVQNGCYGALQNFVRTRSRSGGGGSSASITSRKNVIVGGNDHGRRSAFALQRSFGHAFLQRRRFGETKRTPYSQQSALCLAKWNVGDHVSVRVNDDFHNAVVEETRGGGWYTVTLTDEKVSSEEDRQLKCRGTQLRQLATRADAVTTVQTFAAPNRTRPVIFVDEGYPPEFAPPPPTIHDLDAALSDLSNVTNPQDRELLEQVAHHASFDRWVVFTDLHCAPSTLDTCLEVLTKVHQLAVEHKAGVLFLGDFWHHRGTLRVGCLNSILEHFRSWTVPMVMIPGNHDQVTLGGHNHGLTPIENAYRVNDVPGPLVLSYPTKFRGALFVPHIRDVATMESILQSPVAEESQALFVHADVNGALMNDLVVSVDGIPPASFPKYKRIYSGHFHKPHTVKATHVRIEYLGSPYETSLAEAQQPKALAILDKHWQCVEYHPLHIGRRHFKVSSWQGLMQLHLLSDHPTDTVNSTVYPTDAVKAGDRVVASIVKEEMESIQPAVNDHIAKLREAGVMVEVREVKNTPLDSMGIAGLDDFDRLEEMTPESIWRAYLLEEEKRETLSETQAEGLVDAGIGILEELQADEEPTEDSHQVNDLKLDSITLEGFGPFRESSSYPLCNRGLVLLKGTNNDGGSDSNGSGKSSLAMAALWALTGSLDPRRALDGRVSDVVNDDSKCAKVSLFGSVNNVPFTIARTKTATKGSLVFHLDGDDVTTQSVKETQRLIEEKLSINPNILSRCMFHGQHDLNEMLESTDAKFKEELSLVVPLELWQQATSLARTKSRDAGKRETELNAIIGLRTLDVEALQQRKDDAESALKQKRQELEAELAKAEVEKKRIQEIYEKVSSLDMNDIQSELKILSTSSDELESKRSTLLLERDSDLGPLQNKLEELRHVISELGGRHNNDERAVLSASIKVESARDRVKYVEKKWSVDLSHGPSSTFDTPSICPTCLQPVDSTGEGDSHEHMRKLAEDESTEAVQELEMAESKLLEATETLAETKAILDDRAKLKDEALTNLTMATERWESTLVEIEQHITSTRKEQTTLAENLSRAAQRSQMVTEIESTSSTVEACETAVQFSKQTFDRISAEIDELEQQLIELKLEMDKQHRIARTMSDLAERFGQRGVQTFVLQNVVEALETLSQTYLDDLSDGSLRLRLTLDAGDKISRTAYVVGGDGEYKQRPLSTLSGGQWRRCSLALTFGFSELVARRGKLRPSLCVLDEPLTHLDRSGRAKVGDVIRRMLRPPDNVGRVSGFGGIGLSTVLLILQDLAAEELDEAFDCIDEVVKENRESTIRIDELTT